mmetsp:Transcript_57712/g.160838  ORF Transcript_57712/g.160838 Transcript_57712/m.160838 type:complete len:693 (+) Transcript_57712:98-2176(+)
MQHSCIRPVLSEHLKRCLRRVQQPVRRAIFPGVADWKRQLGRRGFAIYHTPSSPSDGEWVLEHHVKVAPWMARVRPAFDVLRHDKEREMTKAELVDLCPSLQPEIVDGLFSIFDTHQRDGRIRYNELSAYVLLVSGRGTAEEKLEALFPMCDDGKNVVSCESLLTGIKMLYYARFQDTDYVAFKGQQIFEELASETTRVESEASPKETLPLTLRQFVRWARSDRPLVSELRQLLRTPMDNTMVAPVGGIGGGSESFETWTIQTEMSFEKITVINPVVELDGDEMARIIWQMIKEKLIFPFLDLEIDYYDLSITYRDETDDVVLEDAAKAIREHRVGIKCPTIVPDEARVLEFNLKEMWENPTRRFRRLFGGTVFQAPIIIDNIPRFVPGWAKPIVVGRHAHGDTYAASQLVSDAPGTCKLVFEAEGSDVPEERVVYKFRSSLGGVMVGMCNTRESVESFARCCFEYALSQRLPLYLSTKSTILREYDGLFVDVFDGMYQNSYKKALEEKGLWYQHRAIDDMVSQVLRSSGGFVWACKNYDGDIMSNFVAQGYGNRGLMTSTLVTPDGKTVLTEAAHGTVTRHYLAHQRGEKTSTNPIAAIYSWSRGLMHRAQLDGNVRLADFSRALEEACVTCVQNGQMSKDLAARMHGSDDVPASEWLVTEDLINAFANELRLTLSKPLRLAPTAQEEPFE